MLNDIVIPLTQWYRQNKRSLPWRDRHNAYYTWVSEIMLQQTRVEAVKPYFQRFIEELPDVEALAECPEEKLLKLWEGLGYYNRVRNMQLAAQTVMQEYLGVLPASYEALLSLKGIGSYTAGAIASIAYNIPVPAVDGNVLRVITRITENDGDILKQSVKHKIEEQLKEIMPEESPGDFNQALMELGDRTILVIQDGEKTAIRRRPSRGLLAGLYEFPNVSGHLSKEETLEMIREMNLDPLYIEPLPDAKHIFSHIEWRMTAYRVRVSSLEDNNRANLLFVSRKQSDRQYAIPSAFSAYTRYIE